jgi:hypothetical protein
MITWQFIDTILLALVGIVSIPVIILSAYRMFRGKDKVLFLMRDIDTDNLKYKEMTRLRDGISDPRGAYANEIKENKMETQGNYLIDKIKQVYGIKDVLKFQDDFRNTLDKMERLSSVEWNKFTKKYPATKALMHAKLSAGDVMGLINAERSI